VPTLGILQWGSLIRALKENFEDTLQQKVSNPSGWVSLYWTKKPRFQGARRLKDLPQRDQEVCQFLSSLKVVFDTAFLISREFTPRVLKAYIGTIPYS